MGHRPRLLITLGDVAGIGPEVVVKAWAPLQEICQPVVIGDVAALRQAARWADQALEVLAIARIEDAQPSPRQVPCLQATVVPLGAFAWGQVSAATGKAAFDFL